MKTAFQGSVIVVESENMNTGIQLNKLGGGGWKMTVVLALMVSQIQILNNCKKPRNKDNTVSTISQT